MHMGEISQSSNPNRKFSVKETVALLYNSPRNKRRTRLALLDRLSGTLGIFSTSHQAHQHNMLRPRPLRNTHVAGQCEYDGIPNGLVCTLFSCLPRKCLFCLAFRKMPKNLTTTSFTAKQDLGLPLRCVGTHLLSTYEL